MTASLSRVNFLGGRTRLVCRAVLISRVIAGDRPAKRSIPQVLGVRRLLVLSYFAHDLISLQEAYRIFGPDNRVRLEWAGPNGYAEGPDL